MAGILGGISVYFISPWLGLVFCRKLQVPGSEISGREVTRIHRSGAETAPFFALLGTRGCVQ